MTEEDQNAAVGRMVTRFSEAKKRRSVLMSEAEAIGKSIGEVSKALGSIYSVKAFGDGDTRRGDYFGTPDLQPVKPYPDADRVNALLSEIRAVSADIRQLRASLKDAGLSVE